MKKILAAACLALAGCGDSNSIKQVAKIQDLYVLTIPQNQAGDVRAIQDGIFNFCEKKRYCRVSAWIDGDGYPKSFPISDDHLKAQAVSYTQNMSTGVSKFMWNCSMFQDMDSSRCFSD